MIFREATLADITQIQIVRHAVKENVLSNPALVTDADCEEFITHRGKGWVCEIENVIVEIVQKFHLGRFLVKEDLGTATERLYIAGVFRNKGNDLSGDTVFAAQIC